MLVLTREKDQKIVLDFTQLTPEDLAELMAGRQIVHTTVDIHGNKVRHGWDAPDSVKVYRQEVAERMEAEAREGGKATS